MRRLYADATDDHVSVAVAAKDVAEPANPLAGAPWRVVSRATRRAWLSRARPARKLVAVAVVRTVLAARSVAVALSLGPVPVALGAVPLALALGPFSV